MDEDAAYEAGEQLDMAMTEYADLLRVARRLRAALAVVEDLHAPEGGECREPYSSCGICQSLLVLADPAVRALGEEPPDETPPPPPLDGFTPNLQP